MDEKQYQREIDLESKVYFLTYTKPRYVDEIGNIFYGEKKSYPTITGVLKKLDIEGYIEKITDSEKIIDLLSEEEKKDSSKIQRYIINRSYYQATPKRLIEKIEYEIKNKSNIEFNLQEKQILAYFFDHQVFRDFLGLLLFQKLEGNKKIFLKDHANSITVIQTLSILSANLVISTKIGGDKTAIKTKTFPEFKIRFNNILKGKIKHKNKLEEIADECSEKIGGSLLDEIFPEIKENVKAFESFSLGFPLLGTTLLEKLSHASYFEEMLKSLYIQAASLLLPEAFIYFNVSFFGKKKEPPYFLKPIVPFLLEMKHKIEKIKNQSQLGR